MKQASFQILLAFALGCYVTRFIRGGAYWGVDSWLTILLIAGFVVAIWSIDPLNRDDY